MKRPDKNDPKYTVVLRDEESAFKIQWYLRDLEAYIDFLESTRSDSKRMFVSKEG